MPEFGNEAGNKSELDQLRANKQAELEIIKQAEEQRHQLEQHFSELTRKVKERNLASEINAYQSAAGSVAKFLGAGIKQQAMIMIPFEIAEATKEMADFFATKDPTHLASSLKHLLAVKQYADAAKTSAGSGASGSGGSSTAPPAESPEDQTRHKARVVVNVGDGVVINPKEFVRQLVDGLNEAYRDNVRIEFAQ